MKDHAELLEKPTGDLFKKECEKIYHRERRDQNKRPFSKGSSFSKQDGEVAENRNIYEKFHYQWRSISQSRRFPG